MRFWRQAVVTLVATIGAWFTSWRIAAAADLHADVIVLATIMAVSLSRNVARERPRSWRDRAVRVVTMPVVALVAVEVGRLIADHKWWGGAAFVLVMAGAIWLRRFGSPWGAIGTMVSTPFIALLVAPVAPSEARTVWPAVMGIIALLWVVGMQQLAWRIGFVGAPPYMHPAPRQQGWLPVSTRMAVQMGVALAVSYVLGRWWFPDHWTWMLLSCFVVCAGNRGRGDAVQKGLMRLVGALLGTASATVLADRFAPGDKTALYVLFAILGLSVWGRAVNYALWAAGVTAMVSLLNGYYGNGGVEVLVERLAGVTLGALVGVVATWFVLPVHSRDAFRRRWADALAAVSEMLTALRGEGEALPAARDDLAYAVAQLEFLEPAWRLHAWAFRRGDGHPTGLLMRLRDVRRGLDEVAELPSAARLEHRATLVAWAQEMGAVRRRLRGEASEPTRATDVGVDAIDHTSAAIARLDEEFSVDAWGRLKR